MKAKLNSTFVWPDAFLSLELQTWNSIPCAGKEKQSHKQKNLFL